MIVILTEMFETHSDISTFIIDTKKLPTDLGTLIENWPADYINGEYYIGTHMKDEWSSIDGAFYDGIIDVPFTGTIDRVIKFYWE